MSLEVRCSCRTLKKFSVQFSCSVVSNSLWPRGLQHSRLLCPSPTPEACSNSCPSSQWCHPAISSSVVPLLLLPSILLLIIKHTEGYDQVKVKVTQSSLTLCDPMNYTVHRILQARILEWVGFPFFRGSSQPRDQTQISYVAGGFFTSWATGKPKNTGVGSLSLLQWIFSTQESSWGLLHCRQIINQLSYILQIL